MDNEKNTPETPRPDAVPAGDAAPPAPPTSPAPASPTSGVDPDADTRAFPAEPAPATGADSGASPAGAASDGGSRRRRNILIGAGAAVALLVVGGGAFAIGAEIADDDEDDRPGMHAEHDGSARGGQPGGDDRPGDDGRGDDGRGDDADDDRRGDVGPGAPVPASDAASLRDAAEKAITAADAEGAVAIDVERGGYDVEVRLADGTEPDVFVAGDGSTEVRDEDDTEADADPVLDLAKLDAVVTAALDAAEAEVDGTGVVHSVAASDDAGVAYEVTVRFGRSDAEIDLDADLAAVRVDVDD
ncbi:hypothetical protein [Microbacterium sp.]|uniref:hypothetical protein n=1 Tax=Microbacterium sp. TaxID=51671 RepID=UPI002810C413|nr:hypothetical protein [Microbacterium sp.]